MAVGNLLRLLRLLITRSGMAGLESLLLRRLRLRPASLPAWGAGPLLATGWALSGVGFVAPPWGLNNGKALPARLPPARCPA